MQGLKDTIDVMLIIIGSIAFGASIISLAASHNFLGGLGLVAMLVVVRLFITVKERYSE